MIALVLCTLALGQEVAWSTTLGGEAADGSTAVALLEGGDLAVAGWTWSQGSGQVDGLLTRVDPAGTVRWTKALGGPGWDRLEDVAALPDGGLALVGSTTSEGAGGRDLWLVFTDAQGEVRSSRALGGAEDDQGAAVLVLPDGLAIAGSTASEGEGELDAWLVRTDLDGEPLWTLTWGDERSDRARAVALAPDGDLLVAGSWGSSNRELMLARVSAEGELRWVRQHGGGRDDVEWGEDLALLEDGTIAIAGHADVLSTELLDALVVRADPDEGDVLWNTQVGEGTFYDYGYAVVPALGGLLVAGSSLDAATGLGRGYLAFVEQTGEVRWTHTLGGEGSDHLLDVVMTSDWRAVVVGQTTSEGAGSTDGWVMAVDLPVPKCP